MERYTEILVEYLGSLSYKDLSPEVVDKVKYLLYDYLGHTVYSCGETPANILCDVSRELGGVEEATVIGYGYRTNAVQAALINGAMGHMTELDDTHRGTMSHPGDSMMAVALAVGEKCCSKGEEIITALVAGYETAIRAGEAVMPSHYFKGWHPSGTVNTFGSAVVAGKLLGLDNWKMRQAIGLAGALTSGNFAHIPERGMAKDFNTGRAAASGLYAALLAKQGFTGASNFFENQRGGFCLLYADSSDPSRLTEGLGNGYKIMEVAHKPYTACRHIHAAIDASLNIIKEKNVKYDDVAAMKLRIFATGAKFVDDKEPWLEEKGLYGSRFSAQFNTAVALLEGEEGIMKLFDKQYVRQMLDNPALHDMVQKTDVIYDKELDKEFPNKWATIVEIETVNGERLTDRVDYPKGEPEYPMNRQELRNKFTKLTGMAGLSKEQQEKAEKLCFELETLPDIRSLVAQMVIVVNG